MWLLRRSVRSPRPRSAHTLRSIRRGSMPAARRASATTSAAGPSSPVRLLAATRRAVSSTASGISRVPARDRLLRRALPGGKDHGADALLREDLHEERVPRETVDDVRLADAALD